MTTPVYADTPESRSAWLCCPNPDCEQGTNVVTGQPCVTCAGDAGWFVPALNTFCGDCGDFITDGKHKPHCPEAA